MMRRPSAREETLRNRPTAPRPGIGRRLLLLTGLVAILLAVGVAPAGADSPIEGVWSFNGGKVAIQAQGNGVFDGTVVAPTKFTECFHAVGEQMWSQIRLQPDGSYWGLHQWYFDSKDCIPNPRLGPTAWRVLTTTSGSRFLRVCFSDPSGPQPTIAPSGTKANVTYGCVDSALIAPLPAVPNTRGLADIVSLPSNKGCFGRKALRIHLRQPKNDPLKKVVVTINGRKAKGRRITVKRHKGVIVTTIIIRHLPQGTFTVKVRATTVLGNHLVGKRTYHSCRK
jgi:hypothetical protein